jgi:D-glycerate 3-kinase
LTASSPGRPCLTGSPDALSLVLPAVHARLAAHRSVAPFILGLCGAQGSGKSTLAAALANALTQAQVSTAILSLDDLYLGPQARAQLALDIHPLLRTRGVPGTHDMALAARVFEALSHGAPVALPRFDKRTDAPLPPTDWPVTPPGLQLLIFEGWCVGARPQAEAALVTPVNVLEAVEDVDGRWRRHVNAQLAGPYAALFARLDMLLLLAAPDFEIVSDWRIEQERRGAQAMSDDEVRRFVQHYERLTRHILADMPAHADLVLRLGRQRQLL